MKLTRRILAAFLILLMVNLYLPGIAGAEQHNSPAKAAITKHPPQILSTPEEKIPTVEAKRSSWTWLLLIALVGGAAAAAGGGGGDGGGGDGSDTGSIVISGPAP